MEKNPLVGEAYHRALMDAFPSPVVIVDEHLIIHDANRASAQLFGTDIKQSYKRLCGDGIKCVHAQNSPNGCGSTPWCAECIIRQSTKAALQGEAAFKQITHMTLVRDGQPKDLSFLVTGSPFPYAGRQYILLIFEDVTELTELRRIVPMCSFCRKVRDDTNYWQQVEEYFEKHSDLRFSHGLCPDCLKKHYSDPI